MKNIKIREAVYPDIGSMCMMLAGLFSIETDFKADRSKQEKALELILSEVNRTALIAETVSGIAGMITGQLVVSTAAGGYSVLIEDLFVIQEHRRSSIASLLVDSIILWGKEHGALRVQLVADERNKPAMDFYDKYGLSHSRMKGLYKIF